MDLLNVETVAAARAKVMQVVEEEVIDRTKRRDSYSNQDLQTALRHAKMLLILDDLDTLLNKPTEIQGLIDFITSLLSNRGVYLLITARKLLPTNIDYKLQEVTSTTLEIAKQIFQQYAQIEIADQEDLTAVVELIRWLSAGYSDCRYLYEAPL